MMAPIEKLYRRLLMAFGRSLIQAINDMAGDLQRLQIQLGKDEIRDNTPRFAEYGFTSSPKPGARAVAVFVGGDRSNGAVIATDDPRYRVVLQNGEVCLYDDLGRQVYLTRAGIVVNAATGPVTVNNATTVTINASGDVIMNTPLLKVSGDIQDNYNTNPHTVANMRTIYDEHTHNVPNVQAGTSTIVSAVPNQLE